MTESVTTTTKPKLDAETKKLVLDLIKATPINEDDIIDETSRKWYRFGAYNFAVRLSEIIKDD